MEFAKVMTVMAIVAMPALQAMAADDEPKLTVKPTGRVLMDGAVYLPDGDGLADGVALPDIRMGVKAHTASGPERSMPGIRSTSSA